MIDYDIAISYIFKCSLNLQSKFVIMTKASKSNLNKNRATQFRKQGFRPGTRTAAKVEKFKEGGLEFNIRSLELRYSIESEKQVLRGSPSN